MFLVNTNNLALAKMLSKSWQKLGLGGAIFAMSIGFGIPKPLKAGDEEKMPVNLSSIFDKNYSEIQKCSREGIRLILESMRGAGKYCADQQAKKCLFDCKLNLNFDFTDEAADRRQNGQNFHWR